MQTKTKRGRPKAVRPVTKLLESERLLIGLFLGKALQDASTGEEQAALAAQHLGVKRSDYPQWKYWSNVGSAIAWLFHKLEQRQEWYPAYQEKLKELESLPCQQPK